MLDWQALRLVKQVDKDEREETDRQKRDLYDSDEYQ